METEDGASSAKIFRGLRQAITRSQSRGVAYGPEDSSSCGDVRQGAGWGVKLPTPTRLRKPAPSTGLGAAMETLLPMGRRILPRHWRKRTAQVPASISPSVPVPARGDVSSRPMLKLRKGRRSETSKRENKARRKLLSRPMFTPRRPVCASARCAPLHKEGELRGGYERFHAQGDSPAGLLPQKSLIPLDYLTIDCDSGRSAAPR